MNLYAMLKLPFTARSGWPALREANLSFPKLFSHAFLPLALLLPLELYLLGTQHPKMFPQDVGRKSWAVLATVFFLAEIGTSSAMSWVIRQVAKANDVAVDRRDAWLVAAIAPAPMWVCSLGVLVPSMPMSLILVAAGFDLTCGTVYNGIQAISPKSEALIVASIAQSVVATALVAWSLPLAWAMN